MKKLIASLIAGLFAAVAYSAIAADAVKAGGATDKPGRAIDESSAVKSGGAASATKPGRAADEEKDKDKKAKKKKKEEPKT